MLILTYAGRMKVCKSGFAEACARVSQLIGRDLNAWERLQFRRTRFHVVRETVFALNWV